MTKYLGLHETLELLEILTFKSLTLTKASTMGMLASDPVLKDILSAEVHTSREHIQRMKELLTNREER